MVVPVPQENEKRLQVLNSLGVIDSGTEKIYDDITGLTAELCEAPICMVSLIEENRQWFKSQVGLPFFETPIEQSICVYAVAENASFIEVNDTLEDDRSKNNALCHGDKGVRFYAGALLRTFDGWPLGTLCVLDFKPRKLSDQQRRVLTVHAKSVTRQIELTRMLLNQTRGGELNPKVAPDDNFSREVKKKFETLTPRETEVMQLIAGHSGNLSSKQIAKKLAISHRTVDHHRASILSKMNVESVAELLTVGLKSGLISA